MKRVTPRRSSGAVLRKAFQQFGRARIALLGDQFGQRRHIAQCEIESLTRHRMQGLRGIADQYRALRHGRIRACQLQGIARATAGADEPAGAPAEVLLQKLQEILIGGGKRCGGILRGTRPHHGVAAVTQRHQRQRTCRP